MKNKDAVMQWLGEWGAKDGYNNIKDSDEEFFQWIGTRVEWGRVEGNRLSQVFVHMAKQIESGLKADWQRQVS